MYAIIVYDVSQQRVSKLCNYLRTKLNWIQNSVFEGEITNSQLLEIKSEIKNIIEPNTDSVIIFTIQNSQWLQKTIIGTEKNPISNIF